VPQRERSQKSRETPTALFARRQATPPWTGENLGRLYKLREGLLRSLPVLALRSIPSRRYQAVPSEIERTLVRERCTSLLRRVHLIMRPHRWPAWLCFLSLVSLVYAARPRPHSLKKRNPTYTRLSDESLDQLAHLSDLDAALDYNEPESLLARILIPRVSGTKNLTRVQGIVEGHFTDLGWVRTPIS
jgi:hypothetical protein